MSRNEGRDRLPETLIESGGGTPEEQRAAEVLTAALARWDEEPHPASGARIRRALEERLTPEPTPGRWLAWVWSGAAVAVSLAVVILAWPGTDAGHRVLGGTLVRFDGATGTDLMLGTGETFEHQTRVRCTSAVCRLGLEGGVLATLRRDAVFSVEDPTLTEVHQGLVSFDVSPRSVGESFAVRSRTTVVEVVGTAFSVDGRSGTPRVTVSEGVVRVLHQGRETYVSAGEIWPRWRGGGRSEVVPEQAAPEEVRPESAEPQTPVEQPSRRRATPTALLERASGQLGSGAIDDARQTYRQLIDLGGSSVELGSYMLARLELEHGGEPVRAQKLLRELDRSHPSGALAPERQALTIDVSLGLGECAAAREAQKTFERDFPGSRSLLDDVQERFATAGCP